MGAKIPPSLFSSAGMKTRLKFDPTDDCVATKAQLAKEKVDPRSLRLFCSRRFHLVFQKLKKAGRIVELALGKVQSSNLDLP